VHDSPRADASETVRAIAQRLPSIAADGHAIRSIRLQSLSGRGIWYYPKEQPDYNETGSRRGTARSPRRLTANGEVLDATRFRRQPTLPMPVNVRVTNLENAARCGRVTIAALTSTGASSICRKCAGPFGLSPHRHGAGSASPIWPAPTFTGPGLVPSQEIAGVAMAVPAVTVQKVEAAPLATVRCQSRRPVMVRACPSR